MFEPSNEQQNIGEWKGKAIGYRAHAKDGETATTCSECFAVVSIWDVTRHDAWHQAHNGGGPVQLLWDALRRTNDRIDRILNGVVRLK